MPGHQRSKRILHVNLFKEWVPREEKLAGVMLIQRVQEEEEIDDQYLPSTAASNLDIGHLTEQQQALVKRLIITIVSFSEYPGHTNMVEHTIVLKPEAQCESG